MYQKECKWCNELIEVEKQPLYALHVANCKSNPNVEIRNKKNSLKFKGVLRTERITLKKSCPKCSSEFEIVATNSEIRRGKVKNFCSNKCANGRVVSEETKKKISNSLIGNISPKKGKRGERKIYESVCLKCNEKIISAYVKDRKYHKECWLSVSGGIKKGSSRGKSGYYKGYWCDSSYELAYLIYCLDSDIKIERNRKGFEYFYEDKRHLFYPDFIVNGKYVEVKNFRSELTDAKILYFPHEITVIYKTEIGPYLQYAISKYGKDFISVYESK